MFKRISRAICIRLFRDLWFEYNVYTFIKHFGINQYFTYEQGWIGWFINEFLKFKNDKDHEIEILGNGKQVRDILYIDDLLNLFEKIIDKDFNKLNNKVFNVGGGTTNSLSIIELLDFFQGVLRSEL